MHLHQLKQKCLVCTECALSEERKIPVFGEGPLHSEMMLVGEAPGKKEDEEGRPFVGRAGKLLDEVLQNVGIERETVYITNTVKCRPPKNRNPRQKEIKTCVSLYLSRQIEIIDPFLVATLGNIPLRALLEETGIIKTHGKIFEKERLYLATFHPAGIMYRRDLLESFVEDMGKARTIVERSQP